MVRSLTGSVAGEAHEALYVRRGRAVVAAVARGGTALRGEAGLVLVALGTVLARIVASTGTVRLMVIGAGMARLAYRRTGISTEAVHAGEPLEAHALVCPARSSHPRTDKVEVVRQVRRVALGTAGRDTARVGILGMPLTLVQRHPRLVVTVGAKRRSVRLPQDRASLAGRVVDLVTGRAQYLAILKVKLHGGLVPESSTGTERDADRVVRLYSNSARVVRGRTRTVDVTVKADGVAGIVVPEIGLTDVNIYIWRSRVATL